MSTSPCRNMHQAKRAQVTVRALIVDDEEPGRTNVRLSLASHPNWDIVGEYSSAAGLRATLPGISADVVFLDIQMPGESGLGLAASLPELPAPPLVIFVTAHSDYAVQAFELYALDYLTKPWHSKRFNQTVERAEALLSQRQRDSYRQALHDCLRDDGARYLDALTVRSVGLVERVHLEQVRWIGAAGNYVELHLHARTLLHRVTISHIEARLDPKDFLRVHRTAIVRRTECVAFCALGGERYQVRLRCGAVVPVSERHAQAVRQCLDSNP